MANEAAQSNLDVAALAAEPSYHASSLLMEPTRRIDGSTSNPPWNMAEPVLWDFLRQVEIEHVEERVVDVLHGNLWVRYRGQAGELRSGLLSLGGIRGSAMYEVWGEEYSLSPENNDLLRRQQAFYEAAKAFGMEDMAAPVAAREINLVPLISDAVRERVAKHYGISIIKVDESYGTGALLQMLPVNGKNFAEYWSFSGVSDKDRWASASDRLRHSMYRAIILDLLLASANRTLTDLFYVRSNDVVVFYATQVCWPHPAKTADWYLRSRSEGWGRKPAAPGKPAEPSMPADSNELMFLFGSMTDGQKDEWLATARQVTEGMNDELASLLTQVLVEVGVPAANVAGMWGRFAHLKDEPELVLDRPFEYIRNVLVPIRRGFIGGEGTVSAKIAEGVSVLMSNALGKKFDFAAEMRKG